jgi:hypothetical protein
MRISTACLFVVPLSLLSPRAYAIVDQEYVPAFANGVAVVGHGNISDWAQTFTVGISGILTGVDLWVDRQGTVVEPLFIDIRITQNGVPTDADAGANILASATLPPSMFPPSTGISGPLPELLTHLI